MNDKIVSLCEYLQLYLNGELSGQRLDQFESHLESCSNCHKYIEDYKIMMEKFKDSATTIQLPDEIDLKIRKIIHGLVASKQIPKDILDLDDVSSLLQLSLAEVVEIMDELPSFELMGKLRFRRQKILEWIEERERRLSREKYDCGIQKDINIVEFPGG